MCGWIKIHRKLLDWEWYSDTNSTRLFLHLLLKANYKDKKWQGTVIKRGQLLTGRQVLAEETGLSEQMVRTVLDKLKSTNEITIQSTSRFSVITLVKYEEYQDEETESTNKATNKATNKQPTSNQQATTTKEVKNDKKERIEENTLCDSDPDFVNFWNNYDKKVDHEKCYNKWKKLSQSDKMAVMDNLEKYVKSTPDVKFRKNPLTWLNGKCWNDEITTTEETKPEDIEYSPNFRYNEEMKHWEDIENEGRFFKERPRKKKVV